MLRRTLIALVVSMFVGAFGFVTLSHQPAQAAEGLVGAIGCSQTRDIYTGIDMIGADGYWPSGTTSGYGGGALDEWADLSSKYWGYFEGALDKHSDTTDVWIEFCIKDRTDPNATAADLDAAELIVSHVKTLAPSATVHVSPMNDYEGTVCTLIGTEGPAVSRDIAAHLVDAGLALEGPTVGPLDASTVSADGCHANEAGMIMQAEQLELYFSGVLPPSTPPPTTPTIPPVSDPDSPFSDIAGSVFAEDIIWLAEAGITSGCNPPANTRFCPDMEVTRDQMATFLSRALGLPEAQVDLFWDDATSLHEAAINSIGVAAITVGCNPPDNDQYCPAETVTRGQMAAFLVRAYNLSAGPSDLFDDDDGSVFEEDINALGRSGITTGCNPPINDIYCPDENVTRAQMAAFLHRASAIKR